MEYLGNKEALDELETTVARVNEIKEELQKLGKRLDFLKRDTNVGSMVNFPIVKGHQVLDYDTFTNAIDELEGITFMTGMIKQIKANVVNDVELDFEVGDKLETTVPIRCENKSGYGKNRVISLTGNIEFSNGAAFLVVDKANGQYVLKRHWEDHLYYASKNDINLFFKKVGRTEDKIFKLDITVNGFVERTAKELDYIRIFKGNCHEREGFEWHFDFGNYKESIAVEFNYDDVFGIICSAYFKGEPEIEYKDIVMKFGEICKIGFTKMKNEDTFKYNGKITCFQKEQFPRDTFNAKIAERLLNIVGVEELIEEEPEYYQPEENSVV
jgi:hypothetical protein